MQPVAGSERKHDASLARVARDSRGTKTCLRSNPFRAFGRAASTDRGTTGRWGRTEDEQRTRGRDGEGTYAENKIAPREASESRVFAPSSPQARDSQRNYIAREQHEMSTGVFPLYAGWLPPLF